jgi:hypothetical protein
MQVLYTRLLKASNISIYMIVWLSLSMKAIDEEFNRILPIIRQGGYVPGCDHQVAPSTTLENYQYYIMRLKEAMIQAGADRP